MLSRTRRLAETSFYGLTVLLLLLYGFRTSLHTRYIELGLYFGTITISWLEVVFSSFSLTVFFAISAAIALFQIKRQERSSEISNRKESVTAVIPTYHDSGELDKPVNSLREADYDNLEIKIVCEEDDEEAIEKCEELSGYENVDYLINEYSGTKAGALNFAAEKTDSEILAFFDADQVVQNNFVSKSLDYLKEYEVVQSRIVPRPNGMVSSISYAQSILLNYVPGRLFLLFLNYSLAASRGTVMKRSTFEKLEGYDEDVLTEDMAFSFKCYENNIEVKEDLSSVCTENAPSNFKDWWGQRKRWIKGHLQTFGMRLRKLVKYRRFSYLKSTLISGSTIFGGLLALVLIPKFTVLILLNLDIIAALMFTTLITITGAFMIHDMKYLDTSPKLRYSLLAPISLPLYGVVAAKALSEIIFRNDHSWYRIDHN